MTSSFRSLPNPAEIAKTISPVNLVAPSTPPVISIHGDRDTSVPYSQSVHLHDALKRVGVKERLSTITGGGHGSFSRAQNQKAYLAIEEFLRDLGIRPVVVSDEIQRGPTPSPISVGDSVLSRYIGRYRADNGDVLTFTQ